MKHDLQLKSPRRGFSLIEALVALVVVAFGMLALAGFQSSLGVASENAKHRAQALRLAQQKMEQLRGFEQVVSDGGKFDYTADVVSGGPETIDGASGYVTSNPYLRQWWVTKADGVTAGEGTDGQKWIRVRVQWTDRLNQTQNVTVQSVISRAEPGDLGTLAVGPGARQPRTPKNRNVDIPYPAISLPGGKSAFTPPGSSNAYVFDNVSGDVLGYCTSATNISGGVDLDNSDGSITSGCTVSRGYLLSGYIRFLAGGMPSGNETQIDTAITNPTDGTKETGVGVLFPSFAGAMAASSPTFSQVGNAVTSTSVVSSSTFSPVPGASCFAQRQKVMSTNNTAVADINSLVRVTSGSDGLVTVTTAGNHQMDTGQFVSINGTTDATFVGVYVITWLSNNSFSFVQPGLATAATETHSGTPKPTATRIQQVTMAETDTAPTGYSSVVSRFVAYACIVTPSDDDGDESILPAPASVTPRRWWGQLVLMPLLTSGDASVWTMGTGASDRKVCRFTGDYVIDDNVSNSEHPLHYRAVTGALDNQNYLIIDGNQSCPTDSKIAPLTGDYVNTHTLIHQAAAADTSAGVLSTTNSQWATTPEPAPPSSAASGVLPML
jgi:prepilin-type N-terminal cleavage/methylation domain-containing protein